MQMEIMGLKLKGYCCSQMLMEMGLRRLHKENEDLIEAMAGLCDGVQCGCTCGILSAAICFLYLADPQGAQDEFAEEFTEWFEDSFEYRICDELIAGLPINKVEKCPMMLEASITKIGEMLEWDE